MRFIDYLKDKGLSIFVFAMLITFMEIFLIIFNTHIFIMVYMPSTIVLVLIVMFLTDYIRRKSFYDNLKNIVDNLDKKYYLNELIKEPGFLEGKILCDVLNQSSKSMSDSVNEYKYKEMEYREYIELWVHEIKTPISSSKLLIENNKSKITNSIDEELTKIENYVEQVLYYSRSNNVNKDYIVKEIILENVINDVVLKNKNDFITKKIKLNLHDLNSIINSDFKWLEFIINQIVINSIKYSKEENPEIEIFSEVKKNNVVLAIKDNGIGINRSELNNIFEKGFTGNNGRKLKKSTGIGLYLCKKLCDRLGHSIAIDSKEGKYTTITINFPLSSYTKIDN